MIRYQSATSSAPDAEPADAATHDETTVHAATGSDGGSRGDDVPTAETVIRFGAFEFDTDACELRQDGRPIALEPRTFDLLALLVRHVGRTVTRERIFEEVWRGRIVSDAALSSQVKAARKALGDNGSDQRHIVTVHGRGFRLESPVAGETTDPQREPANTAFPTLVVLPCEALDQDGRGSLLAQGITEDIITALARNRWLRVVPRTTATALGARSLGEDEIAQATGADYLVTGTVRRAGGRVRVTARTMDARDMRCLWSENFDRDMSDIFALQDEIATLVSARIATELGYSEQRKAARTPRRNQGAWEIFQLGSVEFQRFTRDSNRRCQRLMRQAIQLDPDFGSAHARLAYAIVLEMVYFEAPHDRARMDEAVASAQRAIVCDDQDANAYFTLGRVRLARCEYDLAIDALSTAIDLNPCHPLSFCGLGDSLAYEGRIEAAIENFQTAIDLSPHDPFRWAFMSYRALAHIFGGQYREAAEWARKATQVPNAHYSAAANLASALGFVGNARQCREAVESLIASCPQFSLDFARDRLFYVKDRSQLERFMEGLRRAGVPAGESQKNDHELEK